MKQDCSRTIVAQDCLISQEVRAFAFDVRVLLKHSDPSSSAAGQRCICTDDINQWHGGFKPSLRNIVTKDMFLAVC